MVNWVKIYQNKFSSKFYKFYSEIYFRHSPKDEHLPKDEYSPKLILSKISICQIRVWICLLRVPYLSINYVVYQKKKKWWNHCNLKNIILSIYFWDQNNNYGFFFMFCCCCCFSIWNIEFIDLFVSFINNKDFFFLW